MLSHLTTQAAASYSDQGRKFDPQAIAHIKWGPGFWDSQGSWAKVEDGPDPTAKVAEHALATAHVIDPQYIELDFDLSFRPEVLFVLTIGAGTKLEAHEEPGISSRAWLSGSAETSLFPGPIWSFEWSAASADPGASSFVFHSNPILGLDDAAIQALFVSLLFESGGVHTLRSDFQLTASFFPDLGEGVSRLAYSFGGASGMGAEAVSTPEPAGWALAAAGLLSLMAFRLSRAIRGYNPNTRFSSPTY